MWRVYLSAEGQWLLVRVGQGECSGCVTANVGSRLDKAIDRGGHRSMPASKSAHSQQPVYLAMVPLVSILRLPFMTILAPLQVGAQQRAQMESQRACAPWAELKGSHPFLDARHP